ncbi:MAG: FAD-binding oxidoreductase, partial [Cyanobacteria bacterium]|nr:FAD-binding oxidoreductase [Cyanobacteriota bacterium]MDW8200852.1 FAD-dependent oxidoreductase [Cyanobacteriota bacterium SKYGB_h_bin112]
MQTVAIVGCGVVGAMIAYELSRCPDMAITVYDRQLPAQGSTGAALGVLMAAISHKVKGSGMHMRLDSIRRYDALIPELEAITGRRIPYNRQGLLHLCFAREELPVWERLAALRQAQGWRLVMLDRAQLQTAYPYLDHPELVAAVHSLDDRQVHPTELTLALVAAAKQQGVQFQLGVTVHGIGAKGQMLTDQGSLSADWIVIAAGIGSSALSQQAVDIRPVLGQALRLRLPTPLGTSALQPVVTGNDTHIVPLGNNEYWVGATVEFPEVDSPDALPQANPGLLEQVRQQAIAFCPALATGEILHQWSGLRPRPYGRSAPIIESLPH